MKGNDAKVVDGVIDGLSQEPCVLGMVVVVTICLVFVAWMFREQRKMEEMRVRQFLRASGAPVETPKPAQQPGESKRPKKKGGKK